MAHVRWESHPRLRNPILLAAFEGWNDAGEAASSAVRYLGERLGAEPFATLDSEEYYDFTVARPQVRLDDEMNRRIEWPTPTFRAALVEGSSRDAVLLSSIEPSLRWRTFTEDVIDVARQLDVQLVITLGALLADVPHTRPIRITGTGADPKLVEEMGLRRSRYEGPTGIVGVLHDACARAGLQSASFWATTPHYLAQTPCPKAALGLVERASAILGTSVDVTELQIASAAYERQVSESVSGDDDLAEYVRRLEEAADETQDEIEIPSTEALAAEVERYLREQRGKG